MKRYIVLLLMFTTLSCAKSNIFIRTSQVGFAPNEIKTAVILSTINLTNETFYILDYKSKKIEYKGLIIKSEGTFGNFPFSYKINFSDFQKKGNYIIKIKSYNSISFEIDKTLYLPVIKELMKFFPIQRCGYTNPKGHKICHIADATSLIDGDEVLNKSIDLTGGWHDAGDYVKFLNTTALTTYTLLFAYDLNKTKLDFDIDKNGIPDILEEVKVGLDWLLRAQTKDNRFITQVQNLQDHDVGWRMPEDDTLTFNRPAYIGIGKNLIGIYSATLSLASRIWEEKFKDVTFSTICLETAKKYYKNRNSVQDIDSSGSGQYLDKTFKGKLSLAAVELYLSTKNTSYLKDAINYATEGGANYWWSYGDISSFAHFRLAKYDKSFRSLMKKGLLHFNNNRKSRLFGETVDLSWGSNVTLIGTAIQANLYKKLNKGANFDTLGIDMRDYMLGKNQWGVSFVSNIGKNYSKNLHHQISFLSKITLPGGFAAGPISRSSLESYNLPFERRDKFAKFQTDFAYYRDDRMDYVTNEPTIIGNAMAILLFSFY